jgi:hypothetical protein
MKTYGVLVVKLHDFLTSVLDGRSLLQARAALTRV